MLFDLHADRRLDPDPSRHGLMPLSDAKTVVVKVPVADCHPTAEAMTIDTQFVMGAECKILAEASNNRCFVQQSSDGYCGFVDVSVFNHKQDAPAHNHRVIAPRTFVYAEPDMKSPRVMALPMNARFVALERCTTRGLDYIQTVHGSILEKHCQPSDVIMSDPMSVAEMLIATPYLWGGASAFGIDCSGLVQLCYNLAGYSVLRDTDMQLATLGETIEPGNLRRGDCVFWKGHVAMMTDADTIIHANGYTMDVTKEPLEQATQRIADLYGAPIAYIRPARQSE